MSDTATFSNDYAWAVTQIKAGQHVRRIAWPSWKHLFLEPGGRTMLMATQIPFPIAVPWSDVLGDEAHNDWGPA
jgi:hypothetical protein